MANTPIDRVAQQLRAAQDASDKLNAFLEKRADAGHFIRTIASDLAASLALLEASLMAARPPLHDQVILQSVILGHTPADKVDGNLWLRLDGVKS